MALIIPILLLACAGNADVGDDTGGDPTDGGATDGGAGDGGGGAFSQESTWVPAIVAHGEVTWTLTYDDAAEASGYFDCSYTRVYDGVQLLDRDYLCPSCDVITRGTATVTTGLDCLAQLSDPIEERTETWAWSDTAFFRSSLVDAPLAELTGIHAADPGGTALAWESEYEAGKGGTMVLSAAGTVSWAEDPDTLVEEALPPHTGDYSCGWPGNDPGDLVLDYEAHIGQTFPNVQLADQCGEPLALWDLYGSWLVIDTSQPDCGPCLAMAESAGAFVEGMSAQGIDVRVVSLLGAGLAQPYSSPSEEVYARFVEDYDHGDPILVDEGFGYAVFSRLAESDIGESFGFPTWVVIDPEMTMVHGNVGFGSWDDVAVVIEGGG